MALVVNDRVKETSTTTGTGTFDLAGAVSGFESFVAGIGTTNTTYYAIVNENGEFEVGLGTVTDAATDTLSRDTIISSSNSDAAVNFSAGTKDVFCTLPASKAVILDASGNIVAQNASNLTALNATQLTSGTVPDARFPATLPALNGSALTALNATQLTSGTVPDARFPATLPALNGSALTDLNASNLASGTVANARLDADLAAIGNLTSAADKGIQFTGSGTAATYDLTTAGKALLDDADAAAQRTTLGLVIGTDVQAYDAQLADIAGLTPTDSNFIVGDGTNFVTESGATARTSLGLGSVATLNTVTLTTNTTGNYVASLTAGALIDVGAAGEGATPSIDVDLSEATDMTEAMVGTDEFIVLDAGSQKRKAAQEINLSIFNNDLPGDIEGVTAGSGLTGGGTSGTVTLNVGAGTAIDVAADTVSVDLSELTTSTSNGDGDFFVVVDSANAQKKLTKANINISGFNNDAGYTSNTGDITGVTAGSGLTGGGSSGGVTLNVGAGTGIDVAADSIAVDVSDFMSNGSNNRVLTATGADAMNAEANMTFDGTDLSIPSKIIHLGDTDTYTQFHAANQWRVVTGGTEMLEVNDSDVQITNGDLLPGTTDAQDLGSSSKVWRNIYTGDLHLSNEAKEEGNAVDGTKGNWTIQEGAEHLYILNNKSGKKYRFKLEEM